MLGFNRPDYHKRWLCGHHWVCHVHKCIECCAIYANEYSDLLQYKQLRPDPLGSVLRDSELLVEWTFNSKSVVYIYSHRPMSSCCRTACHSSKLYSSRWRSRPYSKHCTNNSTSLETILRVLNNSQLHQKPTAGHFFYGHFIRTSCEQALCRHLTRSSFVQHQRVKPGS